MAGILTHKIANEVSLKKCTDTDIISAIEKHKTTYLAAAQGTDCFYFYHYWKLMELWKIKVYSWGAHHYRPRKYLLFMADYVKAMKSDNLLAYILGYIVHHCVDKKIHPLVKADAPKLQDHTLLEYELDVMYALHENVDPYLADRIGYLEQCSEDPDYEIGKMHKWLCDNVYRFVVKGDETAYSDCFKHWAEASKNTDNPTPEQRQEVIDRMNRLKLRFRLDYFIYFKPEDMPAVYDWNKYFKAVDEGIEEALIYQKVIYDYIQNDGDRQAVIDTVDNINLQGKLVIPIEKKYPFLKPIVKQSGLDRII